MFMHNGVGQHTNATQTSRAIATLTLSWAISIGRAETWFFPKRRSTWSPEGISAAGNGRAKNRARAKAARTASQARQLRRLRYLYRDPRRPSLSCEGIDQFRLEHDHVHGRFPTGARSVSCRRLRRGYGAVHDSTAELCDYVLPAASSKWKTWLGLSTERRANCICNIAPPWLRRWRNGVPIPGLSSSSPNVWVWDRFWQGNIEAAYEHELKPTGISLAQLKAAPGGISVAAATLRKIRGSKSRRRSARLNTPDKKVELYSHVFALHGYAPLPEYVEPLISPVSRPDLAAEYPLS